MEYIKGRTFNEWSSSYHSIHGFSEKPTIKNLITALIAYQKHGIVHGDIHGGNILITNDYNVHIIDFGTSYPDKKAQSLSRELYLEFTTLISVLKKEQFYSPDHFIIHANDKKLVVDKEYSNIIHLNPMLLTETLMSYAIIIGLIEINRFNNVDCIKALAFAIANSTYLNLSEVVNSILKKGILDEALFCNILIPHLQTAVYFEYQDDLPDFFCIDLLGVLSLQAYLEWYRDHSLSVTIDYTFDKTILLLASYNIDEIKEIIDNHDLDAIDIFVNYRSYFSIVRELLMMSIKNSWSTRSCTLYYYLNTTIKEKLLDESFLNKLLSYEPEVSLTSITSFFDIIHSELYDAYDALI